jgi:hypothetical protein
MNYWIIKQSDELSSQAGWIYVDVSIVYFPDASNEL